VIRFDHEAINAYLENPYPNPTEKLCQYSKHVSKGKWDINRIDCAICNECYTYDIDHTSQHTKFKRTHLTLIAQVVMLIIAHNIKP